MGDRQLFEIRFDFHQIKFILILSRIVKIFYSSFFLNLSFVIVLSLQTLIFAEEYT